MKVIIQEIKMNLKSLFFWSFGTLFFVVMAGVEFSGYYGNTKINDLMEAMPQAMQDAFGMGSDLSTVTGYIGLIFSFTIVIVAFHAASVGSSLLSNEFRNKTSDFVLSLPISRTSLLLKKYIGGIILCLLMLLITNIAVLFIVFRYEIEPNFFEFYAQYMFAHLLTQMMFLSIGVLASTLFKNPKKSGNFILALLSSFYFLQIMQPLHKNLEFLKYVTPFKFFDSAKILSELSLEMYPFVLTPLVVIVSISISLVKFKQRDITY